MKFYLKNSDENKKKAVRGLEGLMEGQVFCSRIIGFGGIMGRGNIRN
jgi:hypothetical protein